MPAGWRRLWRRIGPVLLRGMQGLGLLLAVGMLVEFLPIDLAIVLVVAVATQGWVWLRLGVHLVTAGRALRR